MNKISIADISISPVRSNRRARILAENKSKPGTYYTMKNLSKSKYKINRISKALKTSAAKGVYLTGDTFYIEVYADKQLKKSIKLDAAKEHPSKAKGSTFVLTNYISEI